MTKFGAVDPNLLYATYERMTDIHWASHDKLFEDLRIGKTVVEGVTRNLTEGEIRQPKVVNRLHDLPDA